MDIKKLCDPLTIDQIDFRIQSINKGGYATILAYKDARVDINRLNEVCGQLGWQRSHSRDNHNCTVSVWSQMGDAGHWVSKEDTGKESMAEAQKGLASDSFKRACFNWGIGLELYDYPIIQVKLNGTGAPMQQGDKITEWFLNDKKKDNWGNPKPDATWNLKLKEWLWYSEFTDNKISFLAAKDVNNMRFKWGQRKQEKK